jgi:hypothetical protein
MRSGVTVLTVVVALAAGAAIGYVDSRPTWDDTGLTAGAVLLASGLLAFLRARAAWLVGLSVGAPVFAFNVIQGGDLGSGAAVGFGLVGAGVGHLLRKAFALGTAPRSSGGPS